MKKMKRSLVLCLVVAMCAGTMIIPARAAVCTEAEAGQYVDGLYQGLLGRPSDPGGRSTHVSMILNDKSGAVGVAEAIVSSNEFVNRGFTNEQFVDAMYRGLLGREPDAQGKQDHLSDMNAGTTRTAIFYKFIGSQEFKDRCTYLHITTGAYTPSSKNPNINQKVVTDSLASQYVERLYLYLLDRAPDSAGLSNWTAQLTNRKMSAAGVAAGIAAGNEFNSKSFTNAEFVQRAYKSLLNREPDATGFASYVSALESGKSRSWVFASICASPEFQKSFGEMNVTPGVISPSSSPNNLINGGAVNVSEAEAYVDRLYLAFLGHYPTAEERDGWVKKLTGRTMSAAGVAAAIAASPEARGIARTRDQFVEAAYSALLGRDPDTSGKGTWVNALANGYSRSWVVSKICSSNEFQTNAELRNMNVVPGYISASGYDMG